MRRALASGEPDWGSFDVVIEGRSRLFPLIAIGGTLGAIAGALKAKRLLLLTDVPGVLDKSKNLIDRLTADSFYLQAIKATNRKPEKTMRS